MIARVHGRLGVAYYLARAAKNIRAAGSQNTALRTRTQSRRRSSFGLRGTLYVTPKLVKRPGKWVTHEQVRVIEPRLP